MKKLLTMALSVLLISMIPFFAYAIGDGNIDTGGGGMGQGTSSNKWSSGNDGVRITIVEAETGSQVSTPIDFSRRSQPSSIYHFGKTNKIQYRSGKALALSAGTPYVCFTVANEMPTIVSSGGKNNIEAIKR